MANRKLGKLKLKATVKAGYYKTSPFVAIPPSFSHPHQVHSIFDQPRFQSQQHSIQVPIHHQHNHHV